jgi:hypothetical protein
VDDKDKKPTQSDTPLSGQLRSPVRPPRPRTAEDSVEVPQVTPDTKADAPAAAAPADNPQVALERIRQKMEQVATEFANGTLNRAQFNAIYTRYSEQRTIVERLLERNPQNQAWKQAAAPGHTSFLRNHFEARLLFYLVFQHNIPTPLAMGGKQQPDMTQISKVLHQLWSSKKRPPAGVARKEMGNGQWLVLALGENALTLIMYMLEPSLMQIHLVRDLHADFERANHVALTRGTRSLDRFVFPQRALTEKQL